MTKLDTSQIHWRKAWHAISPEYATKAEAEIHREMRVGHILFGRYVRAIGYRQDCDDVLFYLGELAPSFAVVHLSYRKETRSDWPSTTLFDTLAAWTEQSMIPDAQEFAL